MKIYSTDNLKLACALASAGFSLAESPERISRNGKEVLNFTFNAVAHGVLAEELAKGFFEGGASDSVQEKVESIIQKYNITPNDYCLMAFDAARAAMHTRAGLMIYLNRRTPLRVQSISGGRTLIYREGMDKGTLLKLANT